MVKRTVFLSLSFLLFLTSHSQEIGYSTTDVGGEIQGYSQGITGGLHVAYNATLHHSIQFRVGYNKINSKLGNLHDSEQGGGPGMGLGYRYYFLLRPHGLFLGVRSDIWRLSIDWKTGVNSGTSKTWTLQPAFEMGYMFLVNDQVFITPSVSAGYISHLQTEGEKVGEGFIALAGLSAGIKF
jgi:hypothetical protein